MRLVCDVEIVNRILPSFNLKKSGKAGRAQLSIGKKPGNGPLADGTLFLMLCTAKDKNGTKYQIKDNIQQVFTKFVSEGKATIRIKDPEQDLCISKADVIHLKSFLSVLRLAVQGKSLDNIKLSSLAPASTKNVEKPKTNMVVLSRREYPMTSNFPGSLESLQFCPILSRRFQQYITCKDWARMERDITNSRIRISECKMKRIDSRIFNLRKLRHLDLSHNIIETVPDDIAKLSELNELKLSHNNLTNLSPTLCLKERLQNSLSLLDLSDNKINLLPLQLCELVNLVCLKLDNNLLQVLPPTIGRLLKLKFLSACNNSLKLLPASFLRLRLETVDFFGNSFLVSEECQVSAETVEVPSLMECTARAIRKHRVTYNTEELHGHLCRYLDGARQCWCGSFCFQASVRYTTHVDLRRIAHTVTAVDVTGGTGVPVEGFLCSPQCLRKFKNNPNAYWR